MVVTTYRGNHPDPRGRLATARLYLCTDARRDTGDLARFVEEALAGGVDIVQLRDKDSAGEKKFGRLEHARNSPPSRSSARRVHATVRSSP